MTWASRDAPTLSPSNSGASGTPEAEPRSGSHENSDAGTTQTGFIGKTTRYGKSKRCINPETGQPGWDEYGDSDTDKGLGCFDDDDNPTLANGDCALTDSLRDALGATKRCMIKVLWTNGRTATFRYNDRAPESDYRLDIYLPWTDDPTIPDTGIVMIQAV